jgi:hypothetical protein
MEKEFDEIFTKVRVCKISKPLLKRIVTDEMIDYLDCLMI